MTGPSMGPTECLTCGTVFVPDGFSPVMPQHPAVESQWCAACWPIIRDYRLVYGYPPALPAVEGNRSEDV